MPAISVIVPVYGVEEYISTCLSSLMNQTFSDAEYLFVDDCTPDRSADIIRETLEASREFAAQSRIVTHETNRGLIAARRTGLKAACGDYVLYVDADDFIREDALEKAYAAVLKTGADVVVFGVEEYHEQTGEYVPSLYKDTIISKESYLGRLISMSTQTASPYLANKLIRRNLLDGLEVLPCANVGEDAVCTVQVVANASRIEGIEDRLYIYNIHEGSMSHPDTKSRCLAKSADESANVRVIAAWLSKKGLLPRYSRELEMRKYLCRYAIGDFAEDSDGYKAWRSTFPEVEGRILFNPLMTWFDRKLYVLRFLKLRTAFLKFSRKIRRL